MKELIFVSIYIVLNLILLAYVLFNERSLDSVKEELKEYWHEYIIIVFLGMPILCILFACESIDWMKEKIRGSN